MTDDKNYSERAIQLVEDNLVMSNATGFRGGGPGAPVALMEPEKLRAEDLAKYEGSGFNVGNGMTGSVGPDHFACFLRAFNGWNAAFAANESLLMRVDCAADIDRAVETGRLGLFVGSHGAEHFRTLDDIDTFFEIGQRHAILINYVQNFIGSGFLESQDSGLSMFGRSVIKHMNEIGMVVDLAHASTRTKLDTFSITTKPVMIGHGNCFALNPIIDNDSDEIIKALAETGGVFGVAALRRLVVADGPAALEDFLNHIDHCVSLVGVEHVALGLDAPIEGWDSLPLEGQPKQPAFMAEIYNVDGKVDGALGKMDIPEITHTQGFFEITDGLIGRGYSDDDIRAILGGSLKRVLSEIWSA